MKKSKKSQKGQKIASNIVDYNGLIG